MIGLVFVLAFGAAWRGHFASAVDEGGGNEGGLVDASCGNKALTYLCSWGGKIQDATSFNLLYIEIDDVKTPIRVATDFLDGSGGGGASWHLYTIDSGKHPDCTNSSAMTDCDVDYNTIKATCGTDDKYPYYISYGWEALRAGRSTTHTQYGPMALHSSGCYTDSNGVTQGGIMCARYNNTVDVPDQERLIFTSDLGLKNLLSKGDDIHLTFAAAQLIWQKAKDKEGSSDYSYKEGTGFYCIPNLVPLFKAMTKVEIDNTEIRSTEWIKEPKTVAPSSTQYDLEIAIDEVHTIVWKHYTMVSEPVHSIGYSVTNGFSNNNNISIVSQPTGGTGSFTDNFAKSFTSSAGNQWYVYDDSPSDAQSRVRKNSYKIKFNKAGIYELCEGIEMPTGGVVSRNQVTSTACVRVKVRGTSRSARSMAVDGDHAANEGYLYTDTGVVSSFTKKLLQLQVPLGEERIIKFSHSAFSTKQNDKVKWIVSALPADTDGNYEIINRMSVATIGSTPIGKEYNKTVSITEPMENNSSMYGNHYVDLYTFKFNNPGTYTFCETSTIAGTKYTEVCVEVVVIKPSGSGTIFGKSNETPWTKYGSSNKVDVNLGIKNINDVITVSFSHLVVGDRKKMTAQYSVSQSYSGNYEIIESKVNSLSGNLNLKHETLLTGMAGVYYEDNYGTGVYNETAKIQLKKKGSYKFCQTLSIGEPGKRSLPVTTACYTAEVTDDTPICEGEEGTSFVRSRAHNSTTGSSGEIVYAKPGDKTSYTQVYNSGAQIYANEEVTEKGGHKDHGNVAGKTSFYPNGLGEKNNNILMRDIKDIESGRRKWSNEFSVSWAPGAKDDDPEQAREFGAGVTGCHGASAKLDITPQHVGDEYISSISTPSPTSAWRTVVEDEKFTWNCWPNTNGDGSEEMCVHPDNADNGIGGKAEYYCETDGYSLVNGNKCQKTATRTWHNGYPYCSDNLAALSSDGTTCTTTITVGTPNKKGECASGTTLVGGACVSTSSVSSNYQPGRWDPGCPSGYSAADGDATCYAYEDAVYGCIRPGQSSPNKDAFDKYHTCSHGNAYIEFGVTYEDSAISKVRVPYNYIIEPSIVAPDGPIYAGELMGSIKSVSAEVLPKRNDATNGNYATKAPNIKSQIIAFVANRDMSGSGATEAGNNLCDYVSGGKVNKQCAKLSENTSGQMLNSRGDMDGSTEALLGLSKSGFYAFDTNAGDYICFAVGVYPHTSGENTNYADIEGDHRWYLSNASCRIVAKKPTFQVHGGGLYSDKNIKVETATKGNLYPDYIKSYTNGGIASEPKLFTSWVEQNLVLKTGATTSTLASGNATAGGGKTKFCQYNTPLSFANFSTIAGTICNEATAFGGAVGEMGGAATAKIGVTKERANYVDYLLPDNITTTVAETYINLNNSSHYKERNTDDNSILRYTLAKNDISLASATITKGVTHVVKSTKNITIDGDLSYANTSYTSLSEIPKLIIYGNNIYINCNVKRIDAILIANNTIDTCYNATDRNDALRSNQLVINGMTISNKLTLGRTYGAAPGNNSDVPGEIINYDSSAVLWSNFVSGAGESGKITTTYHHELAPRM